MKNQIETENKYISDLKRYGADICAETLLGIMRAYVETVFVRYGCESPPSQSSRAKSLLAEINQEIKSMVKAKAKLDDDLKQLFRDRRLLEDFLAVHRTVWILEGKLL